MPMFCLKSSFRFSWVLVIKDDQVVRNVCHHPYILLHMPCHHDHSTMALHQRWATHSKAQNSNISTVIYNRSTYGIVANIFFLNNKLRWLLECGLVCLYFILLKLQGILISLSCLNPCQGKINTDGRSTKPPFKPWRTILLRQFVTDFSADFHKYLGANEEYGKLSSLCYYLQPVSNSGNSTFGPWHRCLTKPS